MFGIGGSELVAILLIAVIVLGPTRLPGVARSLARLYKEFTKVRKQASSAVEEIKQELKLDDDLLEDQPRAKAPLIRPPDGERSSQEKPRQIFSEPLPVPEFDDYLDGTAGARPDPPAAPSEEADMNAAAVREVEDGRGHAPPLQESK